MPVAWAHAYGFVEVLQDLNVSLRIGLLRAVFHLVKATQSTLPHAQAADEAGLGRRCLWLLWYMRGTRRPHRGHQRPETAKRHHLQRLETATACLWRRWRRICWQDRLMAALQHRRYRSEPALTMGTKPCVPSRILICWRPCGRLCSSKPLRRPRRRTHTAGDAHPPEEVGSELGFRVRHFDWIAP